MGPANATDARYEENVGETQEEFDRSLSVVMDGWDTREHVRADVRYALSGSEEKWEELNVIRTTRTATRRSMTRTGGRLGRHGVRGDLRASVVGYRQDSGDEAYCFEVHARHRTELDPPQGVKPAQMSTNSLQWRKQRP